MANKPKIEPQPLTVAPAETLGCDSSVNHGRPLRAVQGRSPFVRPTASCGGPAG